MIRADDQGKERSKKKRHGEYPSLLWLQSGILFLSRINTAIDGAEMMDVSDEDKEAGCVNSAHPECGDGVIMATITASKVFWAA